MKTAYIVQGYRTAVTKSKRGAFRFKRADELAAETIEHLMKNLPEFDKTRIDDARFGSGRCSPDFDLFTDNHVVIKAVAEELTSLMMAAVQSEIYIEDFKKETLISINELNTSIVSFKNVYDGKLVFGDIDIENLLFHIKTYKGETQSNLDVFVDRFADDNPRTGKSHFSLSSSDVSIYNSVFMLSDENIETAKVLHFENLNINATDFLINGSDVSARINTLSFKDSRGNLVTEKVGKGLTRALYATYLTYLSPSDFKYKLTEHSDPRGSFVEILRTKESGQFSFFTAKPGITRGGHYHHTKTEKFVILKGQSLFKFKHIQTGEYLEVKADSSTFEVVETIPGWLHDITNIGGDELIVALWANEMFDKEKPDTYQMSY